MAVEADYYLRAAGVEVGDYWRLERPAGFRWKEVAMVAEEELMSRNRLR